MARGPGKKFEKGKSGNPKGRPPLPADVKQLKELSPAILGRILRKYLLATPEELTAYQQDKNTTALDRIVLSVMTRALIEGDHVRFNFLLERTIGKVPDAPQQHLHLNLANMPRAQALALGEEALAFLRSKGTDE